MLATVAAEAPKQPGTYFFLDEDDEILYVGKAGDLRARLKQHAAAGPATSHLHQRYEEVRQVRWELALDEEAATWREADLIYALRPPFNAESNRRSRLVAAEAPVPFLVVHDGRRPGTLRFELSPVVPAPPARAYGCFPHLGKGVSSRLGIACRDGYVAFLRLLWAAEGTGTQVPAALTRSAPTSVDVAVDPASAPRLHDLLSGVTARPLDDLVDRALARPEFMRPALRRDHTAASGFFDAGPRRVRQLRLRHRRPPGPVSPDVYRALLIEEVRQTIGAPP